MIINKKDLLNALEIVRPGLANRELIEQSTSFAFMGDRIVTYNDEISISHQIEGLDITGAVNATELYNLLSKFKKDEIELTIEKTELRIKCGKAKAGLTLQSEIKLPIDDIGEKGKWKKMPDDLLKAMMFVNGATIKDSTRPILTCVHVNKEGFVEASDALRISKVMLENMLPIETFLIPSMSVTKIVKMNPVKIADGKGWVHFKTEEGTTISCRIFADDNFPDTTPFMKVNGTQITLPESTKEVLDKAMVFCKRDGLIDESVDITLENNRLKVASNSESGWFEEEVKIKYIGEKIIFSIPPYLLKDILSETLDCTIAKDRLKFSGKNWVYITVLKNK